MRNPHAIGAYIVAVALIDQISKYAVIHYLPRDTGIDVVTGFFNLVHVRNSGAAFGLLAGVDFPYRTAFFFTIAVAAVALMIWTVNTAMPPSRVSDIALALFTGGTTGNLCDRLLHGEVIDFLDFHIAGHHWPAFNVADSALCIGVGLFFVCSFAKAPALSGLSTSEDCSHKR